MRRTSTRRTMGLVGAVAVLLALGIYPHRAYEACGRAERYTRAASTIRRTLQELPAGGRFTMANAGESGCGFACTGDPDRESLSREEVARVLETHAAAYERSARAWRSVALRPWAVHRVPQPPVEFVFDRR